MNITSFLKGKLKITPIYCLNQKKSRYNIVISLSYREISEFCSHV